MTHHCLTVSISNQRIICHKTLVNHSTALHWIPSGADASGLSPHQVQPAALASGKLVKGCDLVTALWVLLGGQEPLIIHYARFDIPQWKVEWSRWWLIVNVSKCMKRAAQGMWFQNREQGELKRNWLPATGVMFASIYSYQPWYNSVRVCWHKRFASAAWFMESWNCNCKLLQTHGISVFIEDIYTSTQNKCMTL